MTQYQDMRVLVTDDEPELRFILKNAIETLGVTVFEAADGLEALKILEKENIDLLLTDIRMPNMDGLALIKESTKLYDQLSVIVLTAYGDRDSMLAALSCHVFDFLEKPFITDVVVNRVKNALSLSLQKRYLWAAAREFVVEHCHPMTREQFDSLSDGEKEKILKAGLAIIGLRSFKR